MRTPFENDLYQKYQEHARTQNSILIACVCPKPDESGATYAIKVLAKNNDPWTKIDWLDGTGYIVTIALDLWQPGGYEEAWPFPEGTIHHPNDLLFGKYMNIPPRENITRIDYTGEINRRQVPKYIRGVVCS